MKIPFTLFVAAIVIAISHSTGYGWVGGPWSNDSVDNSSGEGTYQGTIRGKNLSGVVIFGHSPDTETIGRFSVFHEGLVYFGATSAIVNVPSRTIAGNLLGLLPLFQFTTDTTTFPGETEGASLTSSGNSVALTVRTAAEGAFEAEITDQKRSMQFEGSGSVTTFSHGQVATSGELDFDEDSQTVPTNPENEDSSGDTGTATTTSSISSAQLRPSTPFDIEGFRTSYNPPTLVSSFTYSAPQAVSDPDAEEE